MAQRYITVWRKRDNPLDWDHYTSEDEREAAIVIDNIKSIGVHQYRTYPIGDKVDRFSSAY